jgi:hypothetical protein
MSTRFKFNHFLLGIYSMTNLPMFLAQNSANNDAAATAVAAGAGIVALIFMVIYFAVIILTIAGLWKTFSKAGQPGFAAIIPIYNLIILCTVADKPLWWVVLFFTPAAPIMLILANIAIAEKFGKGAAFGLGMTFLGPIFWPMLGFGSAQYTGGGGAAGAPAPPAA